MSKRNYPKLNLIYFDRPSRTWFYLAMSLSEDAKRLRNLREYLDYSQRDLAKEFQVTCGAIAHWESGNRNIPGPILKLLELYEKKGVDSKNSLKALEASREVFKKSIAALKKEDLIPTSETESNIKQSIEGFFIKSYARNPIKAQVKLALIRQIIKSFDGSRGLAIKAAQMASFIDFGIPSDISMLLGDLQNNVKPLPFKVIKKILKESYDLPLKEIFQEITETPLSVTSIAQLHRARLVTGEQVVLKIQHPKIKSLLNVQFRTLNFLTLLKRLTDIGAASVLNEIQSLILTELDYEREVKFQTLFREYYQNNDRIVIPKIFSSHCRKNIIVSNFEEGLSFGAFKQRASQDEFNNAAETISFFHGTSIFRLGMMHSDPHPGNLLFRENKVIFLDFGRISELTQEERLAERALYAAILNSDRNFVIETFKERNLIRNIETFDFDGFWNFIKKQNEHHLSEKPTRFTRKYLNQLETEKQQFKDLHSIKFDPTLMRASLVNVSLANIFAAFEAEVDWRRQSLQILSDK